MTKKGEGFVEEVDLKQPSIHYVELGYYHTLHFENDVCISEGHSMSLKRYKTFYDTFNEQGWEVVEKDLNATPKVMRYNGIFKKQKVEAYLTEHNDSALIIYSLID